MPCGSTAVGFFLTGNIELIDALLKRDFPVDEVDIEGASPLHLATKNKVTSVVAR